MSKIIKIPATDSTFGQGSAQVHIPLALGAIAVFHSVPTGEIGGESLKLDACLLAKIFGGAITTWDHADIKAYLGDKQVVCDANKRAAHQRMGKPLL